MRHNKKSDTGIIFDILVRKYVDSLLENKNNAKPILRLIVKYFNSKSPLYEELSLINLLVKTPISSFETGSRLLTEVKEECKKLKEDVIKDYKFNLILEVYEIIGKDFFSTPIPNYKEIASAYQLINDYKGNVKIKDIREKIMLEEEVISNLIDLQDNKGFTVTQITPKDRLAEKLAYKIYNEKYSNYLSDNEKVIIKEYVSNNDFKSFAVNKFNEIKNELSKTKIKDEKTQNRVKEVSQNIDKLIVSEDMNRLAYNLVLYSDLLTEINKIEEK
jgi:hypothetical protein